MFYSCCVIQLMIYWLLPIGIVALHDMYWLANECRVWQGSLKIGRVALQGAREKPPENVLQMVWAYYLLGFMENLVKTNKN